MPKSANTPAPNVPNVPNVPDSREKPTSTAPTPKDAAKELTKAAKAKAKLAGKNALVIQDIAYQAFPWLSKTQNQIIAAAVVAIPIAIIAFFVMQGRAVNEREQLVLEQNRVKSILEARKQVEINLPTTISKPAVADKDNTSLDGSNKPVDANAPSTAGATTAGAAGAAGTTALQPAAGSVAADCKHTMINGIAPILLQPNTNGRITLHCLSKFAVVYSGITKTPLAVSEYLTSESIKAARLFPRKDNLHVENRLQPYDRAQLTAYNQSGFDKGHMASVSNMPTEISQFEADSLINIVPQNPQLNSEGWARLTGIFRDWLVSHGADAYTVTGPAYQKGGSPYRIGGDENTGVLVPQAIYRAYYVPSIQFTGAIWAANDNSNRYEALTLNELIDRLGIDVMPSVPQSLRNIKPKSIFSTMFESFNFIGE
jgi:DNA/RNA endonuclease G (NUC1)